MIKKYIRTIAWLAASALMITACKNADKEPTEPTEEELVALAREIHKRVITLDTHDDINTANFTDSINYTQNLDTQVNLPKMKEGGLDVAWFVVYTGQDTLSPQGYEKAYANSIDKFNAIHRLCDSIAPDKIELATTSDQVRDIVSRGKLVAMIGVENGYPIGEDISKVKEFYDLGARYMSLAHNGHSQLADSNTGEQDSVWLNNGLSDLGKQVIVEMNRLGMMIDVSHPSIESFNQMIALSKAPIIASHSSARALSNHSRNLNDEQLLKLKENGGVVQTVAFGSYLNGDKYQARSTYATEIGKEVMDSLGHEWVDRSDFGSLTPDERLVYFKNYDSMRKIRDSKLENYFD